MVAIFVKLSDEFDERCCCNIFFSQDPKLNQPAVDKRLTFVRQVIALSAILGVDELASRLFFTDQSTIDLSTGPSGRTEVTKLLIYFSLHCPLKSDAVKKPRKCLVCLDFE